VIGVREIEATQHRRAPHRMSPTTILDNYKLLFDCPKRIQAALTVNMKLADASCFLTNTASNHNLVQMILFETYPSGSPKCRNSPRDSRNGRLAVYIPLSRFKLSFQVSSCIYITAPCNDLGLGHLSVIYIWSPHHQTSIQLPLQVKSSPALLSSNIMAAADYHQANGFAADPYSRFIPPRQPPNPALENALVSLQPCTLCLMLISVINAHSSSGPTRSRQ
jgi:hypothetical protein